MKWYLLIMFLVTPPGPPMKRENKPWTMQSTQTMEFDRLEQCQVVAEELDHSIGKTYTTTIEAWCICKSGGSGSCPTNAGPSFKSSKSTPNPKIPGPPAGDHTFAAPETPGGGSTIGVFQLKH